MSLIEGIFGIPTLPYIFQNTLFHSLKSPGFGAKHFWRERVSARNSFGAKQFWREIVLAGFLG
jgi:hypothetical protein